MRVRSSDLATMRRSQFRSVVPAVDLLGQQVGPRGRKPVLRRILLVRRA